MHTVANILWDAGLIVLIVVIFCSRYEVPTCEHCQGTGTDENAEECKHCYRVRT